MPLNGGHLTRLSVSSESNPAKTRALHSRESRHSDLSELLDFTTGRGLLRNRGLLASNGLLHHAVRNVVRQ
jgi:hypothetical protein